jgi:hypothetical protein
MAKRKISVPNGNRTSIVQQVARYSINVLEKRKIVVCVTGKGPDKLQSSKHVAQYCKIKQVYEAMKFVYLLVWRQTIYYLCC